MRLSTVESWDVVILAGILIGYAAVSGRLRGTVITAAMVFVVAGYLSGTEGFDLLTADFGTGTVKTLAEVTLALVLFTDAAALDTKTLRREASMPGRLLGIGLPLTIVAGALAAYPMFPEFGVFEAVILAILLAPTDAALGQAVVSDERLPSRLRQGLNVESGLNDGVCVPLLFAALALAEVEELNASAGQVMRDLLKEVGIATLVGIAVAVVVVTLTKVSIRHRWMDEAWVQILPLATIAVAYVATAELGGSGFIASFVAGLVFGRLLGPRAHATTMLTEELGQVLSAITFLLFAAAVVGPAITNLDAATVVYAVLSLTLVRMIPVAVSLMGSGAAKPTMAFAGWFGPRGLATIVFMLIILEESALPGVPKIVQVATFTVLLSVFAHGMTATPLTSRYVRWFATHEHHLVMETKQVEHFVQPKGLARSRRPESGPVSGRDAR